MIDQPRGTGDNNKPSVHGRLSTFLREHINPYITFSSFIIGIGTGIWGSGKVAAHVLATAPPDLKHRVLADWVSLAGKVGVYTGAGLVVLLVAMLLRDRLIQTVWVLLRSAVICATGAVLLLIWNRVAMPEVPSAVNLSVAMATDRLSSSHLSAQAEAARYFPLTPSADWQVSAQLPEPGTHVFRGSVIRLQCRPVIPQVAGMTLESAKRLLGHCGVTCDLDDIGGNGWATVVVASQSIPPGVPIERDTTVRLRVWKSLPFLAGMEKDLDQDGRPDVVLMTQGERATDTIQLLNGAAGIRHAYYVERNDPPAYWSLRGTAETTFSIERNARSVLILVLSTADRKHALSIPRSRPPVPTEELWLNGVAVLEYQDGPSKD